MHFNSGSYERLEIFAQMTPKSQLCLTDEEGHMQCLIPDGRSYGRFVFSLQKGCTYTLSAQNTHLCLCYLAGGSQMLQKGIAILTQDGALHSDALRRFIKTPRREVCHLTPPTGWMNDPNGFCYFQGYWHLFYQFNPLRPHPGEMHWGHAVSTDLLHWTHLPVTLLPQPEMQMDPRLKGGAYSGSAFCADGQMRLFFTRRLGFVSSRLPFSEMQCTAVSNDGLVFSEEKRLMILPPEGYTADFRDPCIFRLNDGYHMLLGTARQDGTSAVLHYLSKNLHLWEAVGELFADAPHHAKAMECPDFYQLDDRWVLTVSLMQSQDKGGRIFLMQWYTGDFDGQRFIPRQQGLLDFGTNLYALQSCAHDGRRIAFGWISDFYQEQTERTDGFAGSQSLPRELFLREERLCMRPAREVYTWIGHKLSSGTQRLILPENRYYGKIEFCQQTNFTLLLAQDGAERNLRLIRTGNRIALETTGCASEGVRFEETLPYVNTVEIFADRRVFEIFLNGGELSATKLFFAPIGCFKASFEDPSAVQDMGVWHLGEETNM